MTGWSDLRGFHTDINETKGSLDAVFPSVNVIDVEGLVKSRFNKNLPSIADCMFTLGKNTIYVEFKRMTSARENKHEYAERLSSKAAGTSAIHHRFLKNLKDMRPRSEFWLVTGDSSWEMLSILEKRSDSQYCPSSLLKYRAVDKDGVAPFFDNVKHLSERQFMFWVQENANKIEAPFGNGFPRGDGAEGRRSR